MWERERRSDPTLKASVSKGDCPRSHTYYRVLAVFPPRRTGEPKTAPQGGRDRSRRDVPPDPARSAASATARRRVLSSADRVSKKVYARLVCVIASLKPETNYLPSPRLRSVRGDYVRLNPGAIIYLV